MIEASHAGVVFVIDDEDAIRKSMESLLRCVGIRAQLFASAEDALDAFDEAPPACIVCDVRVPMMNGIEFLRELRRRDPDVPVIMLTGYGDIAMAVECMKLGAGDFLEKPTRPQVLLDRIQELIVEWTERRGHKAERDELADRYAMLTPREREVVGHVMKGQTSKAIASDLGISPRTVHVHRAQAARKMGANSMAELAHLISLAGGKRA